jgi:hypothetical protein
VNNKILEISRVTNSDPSTIEYMLPYNGNSGAFNANPDGLGPVTPKFEQQLPTLIWNLV